jgi:hypothetical protein
VLLTYFLFYMLPGPMLRGANLSFIKWWFYVLL